MALRSIFTPCHNFSYTPLTQSTNGPSRTDVRAAAGTYYREASTASDYGRILGVGPNASKHEVKAAYRKLALRFHPDVCRDEECDVNFMEVNRAYESLMTGSEIHSAQENGFSSHCGESSMYNGFEEAGPAPSAQEDDPWAEFLQSLVNGTYEQPRVDSSRYYDHNKYYTTGSRKKRSTWSSNSFEGTGRPAANFPNIRLHHPEKSQIFF